MIDYTAGFLGAATLLAALYHRRRTGQGSTLDIPLLNAGTWLLSEVVQLKSGELRGNEAVNSTQTGFHPAESLYECADGWIAVAARGDRMAMRFASAVGVDVGKPVADWDDGDRAHIAEAIHARPRSEWLGIFRTADVWAVVCTSLDETRLLSREDFLAAGTVAEYEHPEYGRVRQPGVQYRLSRSVRTSSAPVPALGEQQQTIRNSELAAATERHES